MEMQRIAINQLSEPVREFLAQVQDGQGIVVEDETGRAQYGVIPYVEAAPTGTQTGLGANSAASAENRPESG